MEQNCFWCKKPFQGRENSKFCSRSCSARYGNSLRSKHFVDKVCAICDREYKVIKSRGDSSKYCSRLCSAKARSKTEERAAKRLAFRFLPNKCNVCGKVRRSLLVLHHKDGDHFNNEASNWEILCKGCHGERHAVVPTWGKHTGDL